MSTKSVVSSQFNRHFLTIVSVLMVLCLVFFALNLLEGPRLRRVDIDVAAVIRQPNQRLTVYANQPLANVTKSQITVQPNAAFTVTNSGETLTLQFGERLAYNTTYRVTVRNVHSLYRTHTTSTFTYHFKTAEPTIYYLHRNHDSSTSGTFYTTKKSDQILQTTLTGSDQREVYAAPMIQAYVLSGSNLVVATVNDDGTNSLFLVDTLTKQAEQLTLPATGTVSNLHASPNDRLVGFTFTSNEKDTSNRRYNSVLCTIDVETSQTIHSVTGLDHTPLEALDWQFAPDGTTILAETATGSLLLIDTTNKHNPVPLGQDASITNFSYNGALISAESSAGPIVLDALKHTRSAVTFNTVNATNSYPVSVRFLSNGAGYLARLQMYSDKYQQTDEYFVLNKQGTEKTIYQMHNTSTMVGGYDLSPNDQYMSLELSSSKDDQYDTYPDNSKSYSVHTELLDVATGKVFKNIDGFDLTWQ